MRTVAIEWLVGASAVVATPLAAVHVPITALQEVPEVDAPNPPVVALLKRSDTNLTRPR